MGQQLFIEIMQKVDEFQLHTMNSGHGVAIQWTMTSSYTTSPVTIVPLRLSGPHLEIPGAKGCTPQSCAIIDSPVKRYRTVYFM
jgi:hypothetical protein